MKTWIILIGVLVLLLGIVGYTAANIEVDHFEPSGLGGIDSEGITLNGNLIILNEGFIPLSVDHVNYVLTLENGDVLAEGTVDGGTLALGENSFPMTIKAQYKGVVSGILGALFQEELPATLELEPVIFGFGFTHTQEIDLKNQG